MYTKYQFFIIALFLTSKTSSMELRTHIQNETLKTFIDLCKHNKLTAQETKETARLFSSQYQMQVFQLMYPLNNFKINKTTDFKLANINTLKFNPTGNKLACGKEHTEYLIALDTNTIESCPGLVFYDETRSFIEIRRENATIFNFEGETFSTKPCHCVGVNADKSELFLFYYGNCIVIFDLLNKKEKNSISCFGACEAQQHLTFKDIISIKHAVIDRVRIATLSEGPIYDQKSLVDAMTFHPTDKIIYLAKSLSLN